MEKDLVKKYDNARMKVKACPNDKLLHDNFQYFQHRLKLNF